MKDKIERTIANRRRRMEKDKNDKQRAARKRAQRKNKQEMALLASPNFDPRFVSKRTLIAITRKHFGVQDTAARIQDFLDDESNVIRRYESPLRLNTVHFKDVIHRKFFTLSTGAHVSIQQSAAHYCGEGAVEILGPWHDCMQDGWSRDEATSSQIFSYVPIAKAAEYVDALEARVV